MKLSELIVHCQTCCCHRCRFRRRKIRFETVSRATYDPDRKLVEIVPEVTATDACEVDAGPVLAEEVSIAAVTEIGVAEPAPESATL